MLGRASWIRLASLLLTVAVGVTVPGFSSRVAYAQDDEEKAAKKDDGGEEEEEEEEEGAEDEQGEEGDDDGTKVDKDQPPLTAGSNFTIETYPTAEVERPLILSLGILEGRVGVTAGLNKGAVFKSARLDLQLRYGVLDMLELQARADLGLATPDGGAKVNVIGAGIEASVLYDMIDARLSFEFNTNTEDLDIVFGVPVKYRFNDKIAIIALDRILNIHTAGGSPDLEVGVGGVFQALPILAIVARAKLILPQFDADFLTIPLQVDIQVSPINRVDFGLSAVLANVKGQDGPDPESEDDDIGPIDQRAIQLFVRARL
jgi:hypothetical protein